MSAWVMLMYVSGADITPGHVGRRRMPKPQGVAELVDHHSPNVLPCVLGIRWYGVVVVVSHVSPSEPGMSNQRWLFNDDVHVRQVSGCRADGRLDARLFATGTAVPQPHRDYERVGVLIIAAWGSLATDDQARASPGRVPGGHRSRYGCLDDFRSVGYAWFGLGRLCGLDPAEAMLRQARKRPDIEWVLGDLASIDWCLEFDLVVMTGHAFQVFVEDDQLRESLAAIRSALTGGGRFVFETRNPLAGDWERWTPDNAVEVVHDGRVVRMAHQVETPLTGDRVSFTITFTSPSSQAQAGIVLRPVEVR